MENKPTISILLFMISLFIIAACIACLSVAGQGGPHTIVGHAYYSVDNSYAVGATVDVHNTDTNEWIYNADTVSTIGKYSFNVGPPDPGWSDGNHIKIWIYQDGDNKYQSGNGTTSLIIDINSGSPQVVSDCYLNSPSDHPKNGTLDENTTNKPPIANASSGVPYRGYTYSDITFNGSNSYDSDGTLTLWHWDFGDGNKGFGEIVTHSYSISGTFTVILTVTDDRGAISTDANIAVIEQPAGVPTIPEIEGPTTGKKNTEYAYTALSTDPDGDNITYIFDWGDSTNITQIDFVKSNTTVKATHSWDSAGVYIVTVYVLDENNTKSDAKKIKVLIDVKFIENDIDGYLVDSNSDGKYDSFHSNTTNKETYVEKVGSRKYLIDIDEDGNWDYIFDILTGLDEYREEEGQKETPGFELLSAICTISLVLFWKKHYTKH